jgi:tRNA G18 (ribose-2'-O)-methylase SpoU
MSEKTTDSRTVLRFIRQAKARDCYLPTPGAPPQFQDEGQRAELIPYLGLGLSVGEDGKPGTGDFQAFAAGWLGLEGVMLLQPEPEFDADLRLSIAANNERALRDLLRAYPPGRVGFFYLAADWMLPVLEEFLDGQVMPAREGYYATAATFSPHRPLPARRLLSQEYDLAQGHWSRDVWNELQAGGYAVHACHVDSELRGLCVHWPVASWRHEVHGLQAVRDYRDGAAESVVSSATEEVVREGKVATSTANLATAVESLSAYRRVGYQAFYRVPSFRGIKRGSGRFVDVSVPEFFHGSRPRREREAPPEPGERRPITGSKDPILTQFRDLGHAAGRRERGQFVVEGLTLVGRAIRDGLPVDAVLYTPELSREPEGTPLLEGARLAGIRHHQVSDGLMGRITTTRPLPPVVAAVWVAFREAARLSRVAGGALLVVENVNNPENLGMVLRTVDAAGVDSVVMMGEKTDPFHKLCVRAARGAVGRLPILFCAEPHTYLGRLQEAGFRILGATAHAETDLHGCEFALPVAFIVGNEQMGITQPLLAACTDRVRIPMAPGQDSLNVGVAAGVLLYELLRRRLAEKTAPPCSQPPAVRAGTAPNTSPSGMPESAGG